MTTYLVLGPGAYLGVQPGELLVADLDPGMEERALTRGSLEIIDASGCSVDETRAELPRGWNTTRSDAAEKGD